MGLNDHGLATFAHRCSFSEFPEKKLEQEWIPSGNLTVIMANGELINRDYPLVICDIAIEHGPLSSLIYPLNMVIIYIYIYPSSA